MDLSKILAISGKPGLYKLIAQSKSSMIVESFTDGKRFPAFPHERISSLAEISVFTTSEDLPLKAVLKRIADKTVGTQAISSKAENDELKIFFEEIVPEYDKDRVYISDMKKIVMWYNLLQEHDMLDFTEEETKTENESGDDKSPETLADEEKITG